MLLQKKESPAYCRAFIMNQLWKIDTHYLCYAIYDVWLDQINSFVSTAPLIVRLANSFDKPF